MKVKWGALIVDGRNKIGGHVASKNRGGSYLRTKVTPSNPQSVAQTAARNLFASLSQAWSALTQTVRDGWDGAVEAWQTTDIFGDIKIPTGKNLYLRLNTNASNAGWPAIATAPAKAAMDAANISAVDVAVGAATVTLTDAAADATVRYLVWATPQMSQGTTFVKNKLRVIDEFLSTAAVPGDLYTAYVAKFGAPTAGDNVYFGFNKVLSNGQSSPIQTLKSVIVA